MKSLKLSEIIRGYPHEILSGSLDIEILGIENDSRKLKDGYAFIAEKGYHVDGHEYVDSAALKGARAIIVEKPVELREGLTYILVKDSLDAMAYLSKRFYISNGKINTIGITGTNGKTSVSYFIKNILDSGGKKAGLIGTMGAVVANKKIETANTTPNSLATSKLISKMLKNEDEFCVMEVSSHALDLKRVEYLDFNLGVFTNLSKDHLDHHKTFENYFLSKFKLFEKTRDMNIINIDDKYGKRIVNSLNQDKVLTYGIYGQADIMAKDLKLGLDYSSFKLVTPDYEIPIRLNIPGEFSIYNALAAAGVSYYYGLSKDTIKLGLESLKGVKGRFELVPIDRDYRVIIDFAHTPDGLDQVLRVIDEFVESKKIVVFGAGGDRDPSKRPEMGKVVGTHADLAIVTSDNPRTEDPLKIIKDVSKGVEEAGGNYVEIVDRIEAIHYALDQGQPGDIILLAGKGHETYTILKDRVIDCDERQIVIDYLSKE